MYVLVVDDNPLMRELAQRFIEHLGYAVQVASCASEAITLATAAAPSLALVDVRLPDQDGPLLLAMLRQLPGCQRLPAVAMSGVDEVDLRRLTPLDDTLLLSKPIDLDTLREIVERHMGPAGRAIEA